MAAELAQKPDAPMIFPTQVSKSGELPPAPEINIPYSALNAPVIGAGDVELRPFFASPEAKANAEEAVLAKTSDIVLRELSKQMLLDPLTNVIQRATEDVEAGRPADAMVLMQRSGSTAMADLPNAEPMSQAEKEARTAILREDEKV